MTANPCVATICVGCSLPGFARHACKRQILREGSSYPMKCDCATELTCASWLPAELLAPHITSWGSAPTRLQLKTHSWVPDPVEPWCDRCGRTITQAKKAENPCDGA